MVYEGSDEEDELPTVNPNVQNEKLSATAKLRKQLAAFLDEDESDGGSDEDEDQMQTMIEEKVDGVDGQFRKGGVLYDLNDATDEADESAEPARKKPKTGKKKPIDKDMQVHMKIKSTLQALEKPSTNSKKQSKEQEEEVDMEEDESDESEDIDLKWKDNLAQKASEAFYQRQTGKGNLRKLVYDPDITEEKSDESDDDGEDNRLGGLFKLASDRRTQKQNTLSTKDHVDSSLFPVDKMQDWSKSDVLDSIRDCFVTGKWKDDEDAEELLAMDDLDDMDSEGDFEDLETGQVSKVEKKDDKFEKKKEDLTPEEERKRLIEKKRKLKEQFNSEYDEGGSKKKTYYDELKEELDQQAQLNKSEFDSLDDETRIQYEGYRPGMYVRMEVEDVPCELLTNFNPTYPLIVGALLPGEENIGFVQVMMVFLFLKRNYVVTFRFDV